VRREVDDLVRAIQGLPSGPAYCGLIHGDFELDNLRWPEDERGGGHHVGGGRGAPGAPGAAGTPAMLDFDDCATHWYAADVAFALRDVFDTGAGLEDARVGAFVGGYRAHVPLDDAAFATVPLFSRLARLRSYTTSIRALDLPDSDAHPDWLRGLRRKLETRAAAYAAALRRDVMPTAGDHDPRRVVAEGYDRIADRYARWIADAVVDEARPRYLAHLLDRLPAGARVLELGCGGGGPTTQQLAARFALTGVDISARQLELARTNVPAAQFIHGDMTKIAFAPESFDGVASFYAFGHLPYGELPVLLRRVGRWLRPNGALVATAAGFDPGTVEPNWLGAPMYFSGYAPQDTRQFLAAAGLRIERLEQETIVKDGRPTRFLWIVAHKEEAAAPRGRGDAQ
jgi:SAM-dependent methyltransferase